MPKFYNAFEDMSYTYDKCFLCGETLDSDNSSVEHIFPKWLQQKYDLWNQELILLNDTKIKYRNLTIPCCKKCNGNHLSIIENEIKTAVNLGIEGLKNIDDSIIIKWLTKIKYGILFKELSLKVDRTDPNSKMIISEDVLKDLYITHTLLQSIRFPTSFYGEKPWSVLIFNVHDEDNTYYGADYVIGNIFCMRLGEIGIIATFQDCELNKNTFLKHYNIYTKIKLHPIQFREICAKVHYKESLRLKQPFFRVRMPSKELPTMDIITTGFSGTVYGEWSQFEYARFLEHHWNAWNISFEDIYYDGDLVTTFLTTDSGKVRVYRSGNIEDFEELAD